MPFLPKKPLSRGWAAPLGASLALSLALESRAADTLTARAVLPAATFQAGPPSGSRLGTVPVNGQAVPFASQPVQGFSAALRLDDSTYKVMCDNGYGAMENSADFHLRVYTLRPRFKTKAGGPGTLEILGHFELRDPDRKIAFPITRHFSTDRVLTGADFDIESMQRAPDGSYWFGDEFGPFLLHTDSTGKLLAAPYPLPDFDHPGRQIRSPQNPNFEEATAVRIMNAVQNHSRLHGGAKVPVFSPWHVELDDGNPAVTHYARDSAGAAASGLARASNKLHNVKSVKDAGFPVVVWTVNDKPRMLELMKLGVNGIISDRPDLLRRAVLEFVADTANKAGDWLDSDSLLKVEKFDAQGHRGARNLRPENTIPAMEAALDHLMSTLELDLGLTQDSIPVLDHDPAIEAAKCRDASGLPYTVPVLIRNLTRDSLQKRFICDRITRDTAFQKNDTALSPVSLRYRDSLGLRHIYSIATLRQVFDFVKLYEYHYKTGAGASHPEAARRWKNAARVRFNIETKLNPRQQFEARTLPPAPFAEAVARVIFDKGMQERADVQSFDFRTLLHLQQHPTYKTLRTVYLFGDFPVYTDPNHADSDDGTNMQTENGMNTPWMGGLRWPYRDTRLSNPVRLGRSGGFEGMALSSDGQKLYPLLERTLSGLADSTFLLIHEFNLHLKQYAANQRFIYPLESKANFIGDFVMFNTTQGLVIERDGRQGPQAQHKVIYRITLQGPGQSVKKDTVADLLRLADPFGISATSEAGVHGTGSTFAFPFETIEDIFVIDAWHIGVLCDNNFPFSTGRRPGLDGQAKKPDDNEFILIKLDAPLGTLSSTSLRKSRERLVRLPAPSRIYNLRGQRLPVQGPQPLRKTLPGSFARP